MQGLQRQLTAIQFLPQWKQQHEELSVIQANVTLAKVFHQPYIMDAKDDEINAAIDTLTETLVREKWPSDATNALLSRKVTRAKDSGDYTTLFFATVPWGGSAFDLENPQNRSAPNLSEDARIAVFVRVGLREVLLGECMGAGADGL